MRYLLLVIMSLILSYNFSFSVELTDVSPTDPSKKSIQRVVDEGYLTLYNNKFNANNMISRKELAIALDRLLQKLDSEGKTLSQSELKELANLSKTYKKQLTALESNIDADNTSLGTIKDEQKLLHYDISQVEQDLRSEIEAMKKEQKNQHFYFIIGIISAALLGIVL